MFGMVVWFHSLDVVHDSEIDVAQKANYLARHAQSVFETHELVARRVSDRILEMPWSEISGSQGLHAYLQSIVTAYPQIQAIWIADASGIIRNASQPLPANPVSVVDRDYFITLRNADVGTFIGSTVQARVMEGGLNFNLARRRESLAGGFDGVIVVTVFPRYFSEYWFANAYLEGAAISLVRRDGVLLARAPNPPTETIKLPSESPLLKALGQNVESGTFRARSTVDGMERIFAFKKTGPFDAYLGFGVGTRAAWQSRLNELVKPGIFFLVAAGALFSLAMLAVRRDVRARLANARFNEASRALVLEAERRTQLEAQLRSVEKRRSTAALEKVNRALRTLSLSNEAIVHAVDERELLLAICRILVETGGYVMAWAGYAEDDLHKTVRPVAFFGNDGGFLDATKFSWGDNEFGMGSTGLAIRGGVVQVIQNYEKDAAPAAFREAMLRRGYQSSIALPLAGVGRNFGVLRIYSAERDSFVEDEVRLLGELSENVSHGVRALRAHAEKEKIAKASEHHTQILRKSLEDSIKAMAATVEARDPYTAGHQKRVAELSVAIARKLGMADEQIRGLDLAASIHDLGKIRIPAEILTKSGKVSDIEMMLIRGHAQAGYDILANITFPWPIGDAVLQHHERMDGSGYPNGIKGNEIVMEARIIAVADVVEAIASHRPYRAALGLSKALQVISEGMGTLFDADVVRACLALFKEGRFAFSEL
jgi:hypothetical protein